MSISSDARRYRSNAAWFFHHLFQQKFLLTAVLIGIMIVTLTRTVIPIVLGNIIEQVFTIQDHSALFKLLGLVFLLYCIYNLSDYSTMMVGHYFGQKIEQNMRQEFFDTVQLKPLRYHDNLRTGDLLALATYDLGVINTMISHGSFYLYPFIQVTFTAILLNGTIDYRLALINIPFAILYLLSILDYRHKLSPYAKQRLLRHSALTTAVQDTITGASIVRAFTAEKQERSKFGTAVQSFRDYWRGENEVQARFFTLLVFYSAMGTTFLFSVIFVANGTMTVGNLSSANLLLLSLLSPTNTIFWATKDMMGGFAACSRIFTAISTDEIERDNRQNIEKSNHIQGRIDFENVSFAYNSHKNNSQPILSNLSFSIDPNQRVALVGPTGCGKTTLAKLLLNFYSPQQGTVRIDGTDINDYSLNALRKNIGYIEQDVFLFSRSIKDNIAFGNPTATDEEIIRVAKLAQVDEFVKTLPEGYDTVVGERGTRLSGGQKQRIAIARAFLIDPKILILDDSVSAVDSETEEKIGLAMENILKGRTTIIITHRLHTIRTSDKILLLKHGTILAEGKHDDLIQRSEDYRRIFGKRLSLPEIAHSSGGV